MHKQYSTQFNCCKKNQFAQYCIDVVSNSSDKIQKLPIMKLEKKKGRNQPLQVF